MSIEDNATARALLARAMDALTEAERWATNAPANFAAAAWSNVAHAAASAGELSISIAQAEPRIVVDDLSGAWREGIERVSGRDHKMMVTGEERETIQAVRDGTATVQPVSEGPQIPRETRARRGGTSGYPRDLDAGSVDADADLFDTVSQLQNAMNQQEVRYRTIIVGLLLRHHLASDYIPGETIRETPAYGLQIGENPGALTIRISRTQD